MSLKKKKQTKTKNAHENQTPTFASLLVWGRRGEAAFLVEGEKKSHVHIIIHTRQTSLSKLAYSINNLP